MDPTVFAMLQKSITAKLVLTVDKQACMDITAQVEDQSNQSKEDFILELLPVAEKEEFNSKTTSKPISKDVLLVILKFSQQDNC